MSEAAKFNVWRWLGSLFTDPKVDPTGHEVAALSLTRVLSVGVFVVMVWKWAAAPEGVDPIPMSMLYTFWTLLGLKGVNKVADVFKGNRMVVK